MDAQEIMKRLQEPFLPEDIEWRVGSTNGEKTKGIALAYVTNRAIMNRLDSIFGPFGWRNEFREWKGNSQLCGISVKVEGEWITKWDGADDSQTEAVKGGLSDAMKRAGYQWGIGRYLYNLDNVWVDIVPAGKSFRLKSEPRLPAWALPDGYEYPDAQKRPSEPPKEEQHTDIPPPTLKAKYKQFKGSMDGFEDWIKKQQEKGHNFKQMQEILAKGLLTKAQEQKQEAK
ncbi:Rad52/Rad22 family DNA repair protein [Gorillibacterium sp. sgz5001074]|uniref:Rad52/Rad22 family DNA repair protein n=1 Tax=Gorillibacterium sp. sgz5001074 TaxID=3446695 RepID=UPI003F66BBDB